MKRIAIVILTLIFFAPLASAQNEVSDTTAVKEVSPPAILEVLEQRNMFGNPLVTQSDGVTSSLTDYLAAKSVEKRVGYRILVYYDNDQKARNESKEIESQLRAAYPNHKVYRSYASPYFIVYIGNFRTKTDAMALYNNLLLTYENAKIVKARIGWYSFPSD